MQGLVPREGGAACADAGVCGGTHGSEKGGGARGFGSEGFDGAVAEGIADDAVGVEVGEHFRAEGVDDLGDLGGEGGTGFAEFDEGVGRGGVKGEDKRTQGLENVHTGFTEAQGSEGDGGENDHACVNDGPERDPSRDVALDAVTVSPPS